MLNDFHLFHKQNSVHMGQGYFQKYQGYDFYTSWCQNIAEQTPLDYFLSRLLHEILIKNY